jgi:hypothetical protein
MEVIRKEKHRMARNTSVIGIYPDRNTVSDAIAVLHKVGYRPADISVLSSANQDTKDFGHEKRSKALEGAATGAVVGAIAGAGVAWCVSAQIIAIPGLAPLVGAGQVLAALAGAGAAGAVGWMVGFLAGLSLPEYVAKRYAGRIRRGGILMSVHCDSPEWCSRAKKVLKDTGAQNISASAESSADFGTTDRPTGRSPVTVMVPVEALPVPAPAPAPVPPAVTRID